MENNFVCRVWDKTEGRWHFHDINTLTARCFYLSINGILFFKEKECIKASVDGRYEVSQWTTLTTTKDDPQKIFSGDYLGVDEFPEEILEVVWSCAKWMVFSKNQNSAFDLYTLHGIKILGNKWEGVKEEFPPIKFKNYCLDEYNITGDQLLEWRNKFRKSVFDTIPPIDGIKSKSTLNEERKEEILCAMMRYSDVNKAIPKEWIDELSELIEQLKAARNPERSVATDPL